MNSVLLASIVLLLPNAVAGADESPAQCIGRAHVTACATATDAAPETPDTKAVEKTTAAVPSSDQAPSVSCRYSEAKQYEREASNRSGAPGQQTLWAGRYFEAAAGELVRCARSHSPPLAPWKLYESARVDEASALRMALASGQTGIGITFLMNRINGLTAGIAVNNGAPGQIRASAADAFMRSCVAQDSVSPQPVARDRHVCSALMNNASYINELLDRVVKVADGLDTSINPARSRTQSSRYVGSTRVGPSNLSRARIKSTRPNSELSVVSSPDLEYPEIARKQGWAGEVDIKVEVLADGSVREAVVHRSSGYTPLDESCTTRALNSQYSPKIQDGFAVTDTALFHCSFRNKPDDE